MTKNEIRDLAIKLLAADEESEVIEILTQANLWQQQECWRLYGDRDGNFATIGNQQSRPEAALIEKMVMTMETLPDAAALAEATTATREESAR